MHRFKRYVTVFAGLTTCALVLAGCGDSGGSVSSDDLVPAVVYDYGFGAPVQAATLQIPEGWQTRGGIRWNESIPCITNSMRVEWSAASEDGSYAIELLPGFNWQIAGWHIPMNPCPVSSLQSVQGYLGAVAGELYPGSRVIDYRERADIAAEVAAKSGPAQRTEPNGAQFRSRTEAGEMTIQYQVEGREVEELLVAAVNFTDVTIPGMAGASRMGGVSNTYVVRAPAGKLDRDLAEAARKSFNIDPAWQAQIQAYATQRSNAQAQAQRAAIDSWHAQRMAEISARGAADRAAIRSQTMRDVAEINAAGWKARQASFDRMHRDNVDTIREVNRYYDPVRDRQVELSSHYNYGWRMNDGSYVATDDPNFNPANGEQMQRAR